MKCQDCGNEQSDDCCDWKIRYGGMKKEIDKMPICPECGSEITSLICKQVREVHFELTMEGGHYSYDEPDVMEIHDDSLTEFLCPECMEALTDDEDDAIDFLKGMGI